MSASGACKTAPFLPFPSMSCSLIAIYRQRVFRGVPVRTAARGSRRQRHGHVWCSAETAQPAEAAAHAAVAGAVIGVTLPLTSTLSPTQTLAPTLTRSVSWTRQNMTADGFQACHRESPSIHHLAANLGSDLDSDRDCRAAAHLVVASARETV